MTCIVGLKYNNTVWMGADRQVTLLSVKHELSFPKIFKKGITWVGVSGHINLINAIKYQFNPPDFVKSQSPIEYMGGTFAPSLKKMLKNSNVIKLLDNSIYDNFGLMISVKNHIFVLDGSFGLMEETSDYVAIGSGSEFAMGNLYGTSSIDDPIERIRQSLSAASNFDIYTSGHFDIINVYDSGNEGNK